MAKGVQDYGLQTIFEMITVSLDVRIVNVSVFFCYCNLSAFEQHSRFRALCNFFRAVRSPLSQVLRFPKFQPISEEYWSQKVKSEKLSLIKNSSSCVSKWNPLSFAIFYKRPFKLFTNTDPTRSKLENVS